MRARLAPMLKDGLTRADPGFAMRHELDRQRKASWTHGRFDRACAAADLDRRESVVGYALRYRPLTASGQLAGPETSIASVMVGAMAEIGLKKLVGDRPAYIEVTPQFLRYVDQLPLSPERVVLELAATPQGGRGPAAGPARCHQGRVSDRDRRGHSGRYRRSLMATRQRGETRLSSGRRWRRAR